MVVLDYSYSDHLLKKLGNYSIPVLAIMPPGDSFSRPICLRDIYSENDVIDAIGKAISSANVPNKTDKKIKFKLY